MLLVVVVDVVVVLVVLCLGWVSDSSWKNGMVTSSGGSSER